MQRKLQTFLVALVLLALAGSASAAGTMYILDQDNVNGNYDDLIVLVNVETNQVTFMLKYPTLGNIDKVFLSVPSSDNEGVYGYPTFTVDIATRHKFDLISNPQADGFGDFATGFATTGGSNIVMVIVPVNLPAGELPLTNDGYVAAAHVRELNPPIENPDGGTDESAFVTGNEMIPEFPTIALPIAALFGLAFVFMRRKN